MSLNDYRNEARDFLQRIDADSNMGGILKMLDEEFVLLKKSIGDPGASCHQVYDMLFILFEIAAIGDFDLDREWQHGRERKRQKYFDK
jgi:hypothetical protein